MADSKKFVVQRYEPSGWVDEVAKATYRECEKWQEEEGSRGVRYRIVEVRKDSTEY